jgi:SAM-dependent methyltransferase
MVARSGALRQATRRSIVRRGRAGVAHGVQRVVPRRDRMALDVEPGPSSPAEPVGAEQPHEAPPRPSRPVGLPVLLRDEPLIAPAPVPDAAPPAAPSLPSRDAPRSWLRMDWRAKALIQKLLGVVPGGAAVHHLLQRVGGGLARFERECDVKVEDWRLMVEQLRAARVEVPHATLLEIGTGCYPTFPVCLYLAGAARVLTFDVAPRLRPDMVRQLVARLAHHVPAIAKATGANPAEVELRRGAMSRALGRGASLADATAGVVDYRAPADAVDSGLPSGAFDAVVSNSVLEHVLPDALPAMFREARRVLRPGGVMFHAVNCGDHYAYTDPSIDQLHYLQYSAERWARWNNAFLYQNRLRSSDFTEAARAAGFAIERDTSRATPERLAQLDLILVDPCFAGYTREQLAITSIDFIARKPASR